MGFIQTVWKTNRTLILYGLIGVSGTVIDFLVYAALVGWWNIIPYIATIFSVTLGITNNFVWNAWLNFKVHTSLWVRFVSFYLVGLFGLGLSVLGLFILVDLAGFGVMVAKLITIPIIVVIQFMLNKHVTFKVKEKNNVG